MANAVMKLEIKTEASLQSRHHPQRRLPFIFKVQKELFKYLPVNRETPFIDRMTRKKALEKGEPPTMPPQVEQVHVLSACNEIPYPVLRGISPPERLQIENARDTIAGEMEVLVMKIPVDDPHARGIIGEYVVRDLRLHKFAHLLTGRLFEES